MDAETGLYYYGARYLDPKTSRWLSTDPLVLRCLLILGRILKIFNRNFLACFFFIKCPWGDKR
ncbi:MAG: hypothetical protein LBB82_07300 [Treponema sp.]|nr:hypothetical protein [Treponema sp.]